MASTMIVPPSKHTLFMRGFSVRQDIEKIRDFFSREGGSNTVEFFKESEDQTRLFVALRFETRDTARSILNRYDNTDVMGDRITISWFKDLRKARMKAQQDAQRFRPRDMSPLRNGFRPGKFRPGGGYDNRGRGRTGQRSISGGRHYDRSSSRSRSRSYSRSRSRSPTYSRSPSPRGRSSPSRNNRNRESRGRSAEDVRSSDRHSTDRDDKDYRRSSDNWRTQENGQSRWEASPGRGSSPDRASPSKERQSRSPKKWSKERSPNRSASRDGDRGQSWERTSQDHRSDRRSVESSPPRSGRYLRSAVAPVEQDGRYVSDQSPATRKTRSDREDGTPERDRYYERESSYDRRQRSHSPSPANRTQSPIDSRVSRSPTPNNPGNKNYRRQYEDYDERSDNRVDDRSDNWRGERKHSNSESKRSASKEIRDDAHKRAREVSDYEQSDGWDTRDSDRNSAGKRRKFTNERLDQEGQSHDDASDVGPRSGDKDQDMRAPSTIVSGTGVEHELERGALGLPHDKMVLVREKKEEIEKSYRQDCETFSAVVKMLISKDAEIETLVQATLKENLKEIGQRCIQELREFIEKLKSEDGP